MIVELKRVAAVIIRSQPRNPRVISISTVLIWYKIFGFNEAEICRDSTLRLTEV